MHAWDLRNVAAAGLEERYNLLVHNIPNKVWLLSADIMRSIVLSDRLDRTDILTSTLDELNVKGERV